VQPAGTDLRAITWKRAVSVQADCAGRGGQPDSSGKARSSSGEESPGREHSTASAGSRVNRPDPRIPGFVSFVHFVFNQTDDVAVHRPGGPTDRIPRSVLGVERAARPSVREILAALAAP
jgi:hypothetical protein